MALAEKYFHQYCNSAGITCRVSILFDGFVGSATEVEGQVVPFRKAYDSANDFKFEPIRPSTGEAKLAFGNGNGVDFEEFWTADEREIQLQHIINGQLDWIGFVIPNGFEYELKGGIYYGNLVAADGLSTLEDIPFLDDATGEPYGTQDLTYNTGFQFPWILIATEILRKLDLALNTWTCTPIYEKSMTKTGDTRDADPMATSFVNVKTYINDTQRKDIPYWRDVNEVFNCKEVLENLCYQWGAKVYQSKGVWRIKYVNADASFGVGAEAKYWRKYNTLAVYLGFELLGQDVTIPCATIAQAMIGTDHIVRMDDVYGAFRINYKYALLRTGDDPLSLIKNGDFSDWSNTSKLAAPRFWYRWRAGNNWHLGIRPKDITLEADDAGGFTTAMEIGRQAAGLSTTNIDTTTHPWNATRYSDTVQVTKGDRLFLKAWVKMLVLYQSKNSYRLLNRIQLNTDDGDIYFLRNFTDNAQAGVKGLTWHKDTGKASSIKDDIFVVLDGQMAENWDYGLATTYRWYEFDLEMEAVPATGNLIIDIMNYGASIGKTSGNFPDMFTYFRPSAGKTWNKQLSPRDGDFIASGGWLPLALITGFDIGKIPDADQFAEGQDYIYENQTGRYTLEVDPIEVLHGDTPDPQHVSRIDVPTNVSGIKNFWDTIDLKYGYASLGLIVCKSIMNLYIKPFRIMEGTIKSAGVDIDTRFTFEALPGLQFMLQRATFNEKDNYVEDATFFEISNIAIAAGGSEGQNTLDPVWVFNGRYRCEKDGSNLNTGDIEVQETDTNPNSETFRQTRWVLGDTDITQCPIGEPAKYYWGTDDATLDPANLTSDNFFIDPDDASIIQVFIDNPGGEYIYFVHLSSLGVVDGISAVGQDEIISDFQYLSDILVDGFTYRVLRQNYVTTEFNDLPLSFNFV